MRYGLLGETLKHSFSPQIHASFGISDYKIAELSKDELAFFLKQKEFIGVNVTIPYKEAVIPYCILDEVSEAIGSVNTIVNRNGTLYAYNTDCLGFLYMATNAGISFMGKKVAILGSGGTAKTAVYVSKTQKASEIVVLSRHADSVREMYKEVTIADYTQKELYENAEIVINTTPMGMYPNIDNQAVDLEIFTNLQAVIDVVYNPLCTALTLQAKKMGIKCVNGLSMLVAQAYYAQRYFYNEPPKVKEGDEFLIQRIIAQIETQVRNIVLVGMPGSGKTTIGRMLAEQLGRNFVDTDEEFAKQEGMSAGVFIETYGEDAFRDAESKVIKNFAKEKSLVISTGGGSILLEKNRDYLRQNSMIIYLKRELCKLETKGRPLSADEESLRLLYDYRYPIYVNLADVMVELKEGDCDATVKEVLKLFEGANE